MGANRILLEGNYLFHFVDEEEDFSKYKLLILPDTIRLDESLKEKIEAYQKNGGRILASGMSGIAEDAEAFTLDFGADFAGRNEYCPDYVIWRGKGDGESARVMNAQGYLLENIRGEVFLYRENSYFNRDIRHFCSHQHTPNDESARYPAGVRNGSAMYIGWEIFSDYAKTGRIHDKQIVMSAIESLLGEEKMVSVNLPDRGVVTLRKQEKESRYVAHFLFAHTTLRGEAVQGEKPYPIEVIEDIVPLYNIDVQIRVEEKVKKVCLAPQGTELSFHMEGGRAVFQVPELECHQMVVLEYSSSDRQSAFLCQEL
ncbi:beta-galactosidase trimerization domain-containing protein [Blautia schinkii]|nr:beta-galactosidase trimerization domain-containing protein [Blautia schinkii]